jgi:C-3',4' desaturase CrtD
MNRVVVVGAGIGGLTTAAILAKQGFEVTVLEAHVYPGGCAGTYYHQGYRFDAGATLAGGFYPGGPMDKVAQEAGISRWPAHPSEPAMVVHMPDGRAIPRWTDGRRYAEQRQAFGLAGEAFFRWQEQAADALWDLALRNPAWPPQSLAQAADLVAKGLSWLSDDLRRRLNPALIADAFRPAAAHLKDAPEALRLFVDAQLLISAQATSDSAVALYAASALDLPRRGVVHLEGGMGAIAETLAQSVRQNGGQVLYRQEATRIVMEGGRPVAVETRRGGHFPADVVVANLPPWNIARLLGQAAPAKLRHLPERPLAGWGAFMVYVGLDGSALPADFPLHHQVIVGRPLGEGRTVFLSLSPAWDASRAPAGQRALTISTHTQFGPWYDLYENNRLGYEMSKQMYTERLLDAASRAIPDLREAARLVLPGTPVTFERFTRRAWGWVGGFPQVNLFQSWGPRLAPGLWMVGDSIFPGQSTAAVALGGLRVARDVQLSLQGRRRALKQLRPLEPSGYSSGEAPLG